MNSTSDFDCPDPADLPSGVVILRVHTTAATREEAEGIASALLDRQLAACVQVQGPVTSFYHWNSELQRDEEWLCTIKTLATAWEAVEAAIKELHSYDEPQIVATPVSHASDGYLCWVKESVVIADQSQKS